MLLWYFLNLQKQQTLYFGQMGSGPALLLCRHSVLAPMPSSGKFHTAHPGLDSLEEEKVLWWWWWFSPSETATSKGTHQAVSHVPYIVRFFQILCKIHILHSHYLYKASSRRSDFRIIRTVAHGEQMYIQ